MVKLQFVMYLIIQLEMAGQVYHSEAQQHLFIENVTHSCNLINHSEGTGQGVGWLWGGG